MSIPKVSQSDILQAFDVITPKQLERQQRRQAERDDRLKLLAEFQTLWQEHLSHLVELPSDQQIFTWFKIAKYDWALLSATIENLRARSKHPFDPSDPYSHAMGYYSSCLIRRMRAKYGPPPARKAA
jgi:hypothetical protein